MAAVLDERPSEPSIHHYAKKDELVISGRVGTKPEQGERRTKLVLAALSVKEKGGELRKVPGKLTVYVYGLKRTLRFADRVTVHGDIRLPRNFANPGGFDYKRYLAFKGIRGIVYTGANTLTVVDPENGFSFHESIARKINTRRQQFSRFIFSVVENRKPAAVLTLLTTGLTEQVPRELRENFSKAGASHILAISGLHLSIVAGLFFFLCNSIFRFSSRLLISGANRKIAAVVTLVPLTYYALLSGFSPSTQRAYIMIVVFLFSWVVQKQIDGLNSLCAAGIIILLLDPSSLFSVSFQLSFAAVLFIICGFSLVRDLPAAKKKNFAGRVFVFLCISFFAITGTVPIVMYYFNIICFVQLVTSLVIIPVLGFACVPLGITAFFVFPFVPDLSTFLTVVSEPLVEFSVNFVEYTAGMPFTWARSFTPHSVELVCYYGFMLFLYLGLKYKNKRFFLLLIPVLIAAGIFTAVELNERYNNENLKVTILDVGQGSSFLIQAPDGVTILVDGGGFPYTSGFDSGRYLVAPYLWRNRIMKLDAVILTHPEMDHMNGLIYLFKNFTVDMFIKNNDKRENKAFNDMMKLVREKEIPLLTPPFKNSSVKVKGVDLFFLHPDHSSSGSFSQKSDYNDRSLVFKLTDDTVSVLFPGDIPKRVEEKLTAAHVKKLNSDILIAPHHGSISSSSASFLERVAPEDVVISCGWKNRYGFPAKEVLHRIEKRGAKVYRTDLHGAVKIMSTENDYQIVPTKKGE